MEAPPILILTGPPGVGKTTTAGLLASRFGRAVHLEADSFFRFIVAGYVEPWRPESHDQNEAVMRIVAAAASGYADAGYRTLIDGIVVPRWFLEPLRDALAGAGHRVAYAVLRAPREECVERVRRREGGELFDSEAIADLWRQFDGLGELERNVIDISGLDPERVADQIELRLADGRLAL